MIDGIHMHIRIQVNRHVRMYMKLDDKKHFLMLTSIRLYHWRHKTC